ncbi:MAG: M1 family metallopeptidase [Candidatus Saccharimonas sp.]|nr:MAG: M1 family metallopeptidase [Candidatus Saccharimonas sp.]
MSVNRLVEKFKPEHYELKLDLTQVKNREFNGIVDIFGEINNEKEITFHSKDLEIKNIISSNDIKLNFSKAENDEILVNIEKLNFKKGDKIQLKIEFSGKITDAMHGLYPCYYKENGEKKELFATQFESHHAREVFPCIDEPEAKVTFSLEIRALSDLEVLSNTEIIEKNENGNIQQVRFAKTPKMSTYLLAFVLGDFQRVSKKTKSGVEVSVLATKAQKSELMEFPLSFAVRVLEFYEDFFGQKFPLSKCDHIALPDFSSGAMENWGLITYRETALLAGKNSSISSKKYVALVIAHETSHQWFGNLVTMKWWDELWLNESFATMMEYLATDALEPKWRIWEEFAVNEAVLSLRRDAIDGVQAVHVPVHHPDEISTIFDGAIVYAKGARLMNMLRRYVGNDAFQKGLQRYFDKFKYQNTIGENLWDCLSEASGKNVADFMNPWLLKSGYPSVLAEGDGEELKLSQKQFFIGEGKDSGRIWPILLGSNQNNLPEIMDSKDLTCKKSSDFVQLNQGNVAHFITNYSQNLFENLLEKVRDGDLDTISRLQILQERSLLSRGGEIPSVELLRTLESYDKETSLTVWDMISLLIGELKIFIDEDSVSSKKMKKFVGNLAQNEFEKLGFIKKTGEDEEDTQKRSSILAHMIYAENKKAISGALDIFENSPNMEDIDSEIRSLILTAKIRFEESPELVQRMLENYKNTSNVDYRDDIMVALTSTKNIRTGKLLLEKMLENDIIRTQDILSWYVHLLRNLKTRELAWKWLRENWKLIEEKFDGDKSYNDFPRYSGAILRTEKQLQEFKEFFEPLKNDPSLTRAIEMGEREIAGRVDLIKRDKTAIDKFLQNI